MGTRYDPQNRKASEKFCDSLKQIFTNNISTLLIEYGCKSIWTWRAAGLEGENVFNFFKSRLLTNPLVIIIRNSGIHVTKQVDTHILRKSAQELGKWCKMADPTSLTSSET